MVSTDFNLSVVYLPTESLKPYANNARTHSKKQIGQIADSIRAFGFINPVLIDKNNVIIAGHGKVAAAKKLNLPIVPTISLTHMSEDQKQAYIIADNRLAELAGWDKSILAIEFQNLIKVETEFHITTTGFEMPDIDFIIQNHKDVSETEEESVLPDMLLPPVSLPGDIWILGEHRLYCGNALEEASYQALMPGEKAQLVFSDPPYNVPIRGHVSGLGKVEHAEFAMASGEMPEQDFIGFLSKVFRLKMQFSEDGSIHFICMDWRHGFEMLTAARTTQYELKNICVWNKNNGGMGSFYRSKHEFIYVFKNGTAPHINNIELGRHGRYRTNVWDYAGQNSMHADRDTELAMHPTVKPVKLVADALLDCSHRGGPVLDPFGGSGSTLIAAEKTGRRARLIELDPKYVDVTIRRWQELTGQEATLAQTGETFAALENKVKEIAHAE